MITGVTGTLMASIVVTSTCLPAVSVYAADGNGTAKDEVVYVITDAGGRTDSVNVVNIFGKGSVTDYGNYSEVKLLNTTDDILKKDDKITFATDKDRVYYQGTLDHAQLPWKLAITYELDGSPISAEELAGKSGSLVIHILITKNEKCRTDFYDQFALTAAFTLDTQTCKNIKAEGATLANVGADKQISYTVLPGKGLDAEITADVTDFEMDAASINGIKLDLDVEVDDAELMEKVKQIQDGAADLKAGTKELSDGTLKVKDGGFDLVDGTKELNQGVISLDRGISDLDHGVDTMQKALNTLHAKSKNLTDGSSRFLSALKTMQAQLSKVAVTEESLQQLTDSSSAIRQGIDSAYQGAVALQQSASYESYKSAMKENGLDIDTLLTGNTQTIESLSKQINELSEAVARLKSIPGYESDTTYAEQVSQLETTISSLKQVVTLLQGDSATIAGTRSYLDQVSEGASQLAGGLSQLKTNYETFDGAIQEISDKLSGMTVQVNTLSGAVHELVESYEELDSGIDQYTDSVAQIVAAYSQIADGTDALTVGGTHLAEGAQTLQQGSVELYHGITALDDGSRKLQNGTDEFYTKTADADTQVKNKMDDMIEEISGGNEPVVSFVSDKNTNVKSVQFVIKTSAIEKEETEPATVTTTEKKNFWQKLVELFITK